MTSTYLTGCTVITCAATGSVADTVLPDATLEVANGRIVGVGSVPLPTDAVAYDLRGHYLIPGLWDAHVHLGGLVPPYEGRLSEADPRHHMARCIAKAQDNLKHGITAVRSLGERDNADLLLRDLIASGVVVGPRVYASGDVKWSRLETGADNFRRRVRQLVFAGVDQVKLMITGGIPYPGPVTALTTQRDELSAAIVEAHEWGRPVAVHAMGDEPVRMAIECGADTIEHAFACTPAIAEAFQRDGLTFCPNLAVTDAWSRESVRAQGLPEWMADNAEASRSGHHELFAEAARLGVRTCAGVDNLPRRGPNDLGIERVDERVGLVRELELMIDLGLSPLDALRAATVNAASVVGAIDEVGSIEAGKAADFIVLDRDPLDDIDALSDVAQVWMAGTRVH